MYVMSIYDSYIDKTSYFTSKNLDVIKSKLNDFLSLLKKTGYSFSLGSFDPDKDCSFEISGKYTMSHEKSHYLYRLDIEVVNAFDLD